MTESEVIERILYMGVGRSGLENENSCIAKALRELQQYRAIGTVERFKELDEKATAKKPNPYVQDYTSIRFLEFVCPNCKEKVSDILAPTYCNCGQKLLWNRSERLRIHND